MEIKKISPINENYYKIAKDTWDRVAKPLDSLGEFERVIARICAIQENDRPILDKSLIFVMCADNGIVFEGVSQSDQSVTSICASNIGLGKSTLGVMARAAKTDIVAVDVGINNENKLIGTIDRRVMSGTNDFLLEPAMSIEEAKKAIQVGIDLVKEYKDKGYSLIGIGEMGIGNTTTSSAMAAAFLGKEASFVTGRGAGLSDAGLKHKIEVIDEAIKKYGLSRTCFDRSGINDKISENDESKKKCEESQKMNHIQEDVMKILSSVGGLDIAAMAGVVIGGALYNVPVVVDGFISMVAAFTAEKLAPGSKDYAIASHISREPAAIMLANEIGLKPVISADMALGEGTGAALMISMIRTMAEVYSSSVAFAETGIEQYTRFDEE